MKGLQTLSKIRIGGKDGFPISGLKNLKNLRPRVCIDGLDKLQNNDQAREVDVSQMRPSELVVEWSDVFDKSRKQRLETEVLDMLKPHSDNLKKLEVVSYGGTKFPKWITDSSFIMLTSVSIHKCRNCKFLPPLGHMPSLKKFFIESMDDVKEVGLELLGNGPTAFPSLEIQDLKTCHNGRYGQLINVGGVVFPCLKELHIEECPKMARWEVRSANGDVIVFSCLQELLVNRCPNLVKVSLKALPSLRNLKVWNCGDVLLTSLVSLASSITKLSIIHILGLRDEMWGSVVEYLGALEELRISSCEKIRNLWEASEACKEVRVNLKKLEIWYCEKLVKIGGEKEEGEGNNLPLLTSLKMIKVWRCKNLKHLSCPGNIETLDIGVCENLEHLSCPPNSIQELKIYDCNSITCVTFPTERRRWQKLKSLDIRNCNSVLNEEFEKKMVIIINNNINTPPMLQVLNINCWENLKSVTIFRCFIQFTKLEIKDCRRIEVFPNLQNLTSLKHLEISECTSMDGPPHRRSSYVSGVWPPKLDSLRIGKLKRPISEWGPLPISLVELVLWGGFGSSSIEEEDDVKSFPASLLPYSLSSSLSELMLIGFKNMERISSGLQHLTSLQHLRIVNCPEMKDLPETLLSSLLSLYISSCPNEELKEKMMSKKGFYGPLISHIPKVEIHF